MITHKLGSAASSIPNDRLGANRFITARLSQSDDFRTIPASKARAVHSYCKDFVLKDAGRIEFLRMLFMEMTAKGNPKRISTGELHNWSELIDGTAFCSIARPTFDNFIKKGVKSTRSPSEELVQTLLCLAHIINIYRHPCLQFAKAKVLMERCQEVAAINVALSGASLRLDEKIIAAGDHLYEFLGFNRSNIVSDHILESHLFSQQGDVENNDWRLNILAIRLAASDGNYITSNAMVRRLTSRTLSGTNRTFLYVETTTHEDKKQVIRSSGYIIINNSNDVYFLQRQDSGSFNIVYIPTSELSQTGWGFSKGLILSFDGLTQSGGIASRICVINNHNNVVIPGLISSEKLEDYFKDNAEKLGVSFSDVYDYLHKVGNIKLARIKGDVILNQEIEPIHNWLQVQEYIEQAIKRGKFDKKARIDGFLGQPLRPI